MDATVTTKANFVVGSRFRDITTGSKFPILHHIAHQIPQHHHTNVLPSHPVPAPQIRLTILRFTKFHLRMYALYVQGGSKK